MYKITITGRIPGNSRRIRAALGHQPERDPFVLSQILRRLGQSLYDPLCLESEGKLLLLDAADSLEQLAEKHYSECVQIAHYDDELQLLRRENASLRMAVWEKDQRLRLMRQLIELQGRLNAAEKAAEQGQEDCCGGQT